MEIENKRKQKINKNTRKTRKGGRNCKCSEEWRLKWKINKIAVANLNSNFIPSMKILKIFHSSQFRQK
jgi:hypothetical protein